ncbi:SMC1 [[Candida] subhashii]|uniref:Structural maintenance of chromosomes protein n=1 Tax=[Candida] subhashii TaxID=561895 RepID=A0A8J5QLI1_9ASCO|nr:SMC1 [[Candida] subhashii]KAG7662663.1 SMC1 [[Candida] subhashii]
MGRLIGLELYNFKSYRGKAVIGFGDSFFTSIIGPNGAGKSNMMDAISFVLGVQSSHLRSQNLRDLIYRGRRENMPDNTVDSIDQDPTNAYVMATYAKSNGEILKLKRSITASGHSDYQINGRSVTVLNYTMVLKQENILIKARNFLVFQGDVEQIASQSPKELTKLIEHVSGSNEYVKEFEQLKEQSEKAREVSNSVFSRKRTLNSESKQYKEQVAEQREFEEKIVLKNEVIKKIHLYKLFHNEKKHYQLKEDIRAKNTDLKELKKDLATKEKTYSTLMSEYSKSIIDTKQHKQAIETNAVKIESTKRELIPIGANKQSLSTKINSQKNKIQDLENDLKRQKIQLQSVEKQLRDAQKLFKEFQEKTTSYGSSHVSVQGQKEYEALRAQFLADNGSKLEEELSLLLSDKENINTIIANIKNQKSNADNRRNELESIINTELKSKLSDIANEISEILDKKNSKEKSRNSLIRKKEEFNFQELQLNTQLREVLLKLEDLSSQQRESNKQKKLRENVSTLKRLLPQGAIKGLVCELVRPSQQKYESALSTLLGRNFDSIIVSTSAVAYKCIEILKDRRAGVATFIPLDTVQSDPINTNHLRSIDSNASPGVDVVEYSDKSLEQAINYIIGNALVVDNIDTARRIKWSNNSGTSFGNKIVTLDGSVIHTSGLMTGGQQAQRTAAVLTWDKQEWNRLNELKEDLVNRVSKLQEDKPKELEINLLAEEIHSLEDRLPVLRNQKSSVERVNEDRKSEIAYQEELIKGLDSTINDKSNSISLVESKISKIADQMKILQDKIYGAFCDKYGFTNGIEDYENTHGSTLRIRAKERVQYTKAISALQNKLEFEQERCKETKERKRSLENQIVDLENELEVVLAEKRKLEEILDTAEAEHEVLKSELNQKDKSSQSKLKTAKSVESDVREAQSEVSIVSKEIIQIEEMLLKADSERADVLRNCKIQNINLPLQDGILESISVGETSEDILQEIYKIEIDYSLLDERLRENFTIQIQGELEVSLQSTIEQLEQLNPNGRADERLQQVEARLKEHDKEYTLARQQERQISEKFKEVKEQRYKTFMDAFTHVSSRIDEIYKELTKSSASPLGGSAYLTLEDEEMPYTSGIKYHAMPPMKRFQDMDLLSGGEKTMAALALLFAIHSYQPSPFFVLDEVDAALDNANVTKIANYIRKYAGPSFQFIVISLKTSLFEKSDALVGIYREQRENSSKTVTLDLRDYPEDEAPIAAGAS